MSTIEVTIKIPTDSQATKELVEILAKLVSQGQVIQRQEPKAKVSSPEIEAKRKVKEKELRDLKTLLEIATARAQKDVVAETQAKIKEIEAELANL